MDLSKWCNGLKTLDKGYFRHIIHIIQLINQSKYRMYLFKYENIINICECKYRRNPIWP